MPDIIINESKCTKCNLCATICTFGLINGSTDSSYPNINEETRQYCSLCGHCEAFCSQNALNLDYSIEEKIKSNPEDCSINFNDLSLYIKNRRSIRHYSSKNVEKELITKIIDTAKYAATGGNSQLVNWQIIYDFQDVQKIANLTVDFMRSIQGGTHFLSNYVEPIITAWDHGKDLICHNAPHLVFTLVPENPENDVTDAIIALTHFDIIAPSYQLGTCWAGFIKFAIQVKYKPLMDFLDISEENIIGYPMMFGYPKYKAYSIPRRNPAKIIWK